MLVYIQLSSLPPARLVIRVQVTGAAVSAEMSRPPSPTTSSSSSQRTLTHSRTRDKVSPLCSILGPPAGSTCLKKHFLGGIPVRCLNHISWLLSMWRSRGSTLSPSQIIELFTLFLRESTATLWRKLISIVCILDLILSVTTESS